MALHFVSPGNSILLLWSGSQGAENLKEYVGKLTDLVTGTGSVNVENIDRLQLCKLNIEKKSKRHLYDGIEIEKLNIANFTIAHNTLRVGGVLVSSSLC